MSTPEQRRWPRIKRAFMVRYRPAEKEATTGWLASPIKDLSQQGMRFLSERPFAVDTVLELQLLLPTQSDPTALWGRVVRSNPQPMHLHELGIQFEADRDSQSYQAIAAAIAQAMKAPS